MTMLPTAWDRPRLSAYNLMRGDLEGAGEALLAPDQLSPEQLGWKPKDKGGISGALFRTVTNPLVILGAVLAMKYPFPAVREMVRSSSRALNRYDKTLAPLAWRIQDLKGIFRDTMFADIVDKMCNEIDGFKNGLTALYNDGLVAFKSRTGRLPSFAESNASSMVQEGLVTPEGLNQKHPVWGYVKAALEKVGIAGEETEAMLGEVNVQHILGNHAPELVKAGRDVSTGSLEEFLKPANLYRTMRGKAYKRLVGADKVQVAAMIDKASPSRMATIANNLGIDISDLVGQGAVDLEALQGSVLEKRLIRVAKRRGVDVTELPARVLERERLRVGLLERAAAALPDQEVLSVEKLTKASPNQLLKMAHSLGVDIPMIPETAGASRAWMERLRGDIGRELFGAREGYFPHVTVKSQGEIEASIAQAWEETPAARAGKNVAGADRVITDRMKDFRNATLPDPDSLRELGTGVFPDRFLKALDSLKQVEDEWGRKKFHFYSLRHTAVHQDYIRTMGSTYGWVTRGWGERIKNQVEGPMKAQAMRSNEARIRYNLARETLIPAAMGKMSQSEAMYQLGWSAQKRRAFDFFGRADVQKAMSPELARKFQNFLASPSVQNLTWKNAGAKVANWFYNSALGLNPASAGMNMMQNLMTTSGVVPPKHLMSGFTKATQASQRFFNLYGGGVDAETAFLKAFPEWLEIGGTTEAEAMGNLRRAIAGGAGNATMDRLEQAKSILMSMFTASERFNKMWAFYAGEDWALGSRVAFAPGARPAALSPAFAKQVGKKVMELTQFPGGMLNRPVGLMNLWPPLQQFTQFPLKTAGLFMRDRGTAGRMLLSGALTYEAGRAAGVDLSHGLLFGAMPFPDNPDQPFYPLPVVPPLVGLVGGAISDISQGSFDQTRRNLPLLIPGGVELARASTILSPKLAQVLGRSYADYQNPRPDGTIPLYSADGSLKGFKSPMSLFADAVGFKTLTGDREGELSNYLVKQRDKIRAIRRSYIEALAGNNAARARQINEQYKKMFPGIGDITVKDSDIQAVHLRHDVTRLERILQTMPGELRAQYGEMVTTGLGEAAEQFMGVDPELLASAPSVKQRDARRLVPQGQATQNLSQSKGLLPTGPQGVLRQDQTGQQPSSVFGALEGFSAFGQ